MLTWILMVLLGTPVLLVTIYGIVSFIRGDLHG